MGGFESQAPTQAIVIYVSTACNSSLPKAYEAHKGIRISTSYVRKWLSFMYIEII